MLKIVLLTVAAFVGVASLAAAAAGPDGTPLRMAEVIQEDGARLKFCVGPARLLFGGERVVTVRFGGEGCGRAEGVLGITVERGNAAPADPAAAVRALLS